MARHGESSKRAEKISRKDRELVIAATLDRNDIQISEEDSNSPTTASPNIEATDPSQGKKKKTRGPSKLRLLERGKEQCYKIEFNDRDQPIGPNSVTLSTLQGILAREIVPLTMKNWLDLPKEVENKLWAAVTLRYNLNECHKKYIMKKLGKLWRDYKSILSRKVRQLAEKGNVMRHLALIKPENISLKEWEEFVKQRISPEFKAKSEKFRKMRAQQTHPHTMSRKGYARLEDEMNKKSPTTSALSRVDVWIQGHKRSDGKPINEEVNDAMVKIHEHSQEASNQSKTSIGEDALAHVLGPERRGRVRGLGFGALPSRVDAQIHQGGKYMKLQDELHELKKEFEQFKTMFMRPNEDQISQGVENMMHTPTSQVVKQHETLLANASPEELASLRSRANAEISNQHVSNLENVKCILLHWEGTGVEVAKGKIASTDPKSKVHFVSLGPGCWKMWVDQILVENVPLFRPTRDMFNLDEAFGTTIAWPIQAIRLE